MCICKKCCCKKKKKEKEKKGVFHQCTCVNVNFSGLKSGSQPDKGQPLLDKVQPDMDELDELTKKDEVKNLGKLQYSLDYDFQQNNVRNMFNRIIIFNLSLIA